MWLWCSDLHRYYSRIGLDHLAGRTALKYLRYWISMTEGVFMILEGESLEELVEGPQSLLRTIRSPHFRTVKSCGF